MWCRHWQKIWRLGILTRSRRQLLKGMTHQICSRSTPKTRRHQVSQGKQSHNSWKIATLTSQMITAKTKERREVNLCFSRNPTLHQSPSQERKATRNKVCNTVTVVFSLQTPSLFPIAFGEQGLVRWSLWCLCSIVVWRWWRCFDDDYLY